MLEIRSNCEHCGRALPWDSVEARICSFECTFCADCVEGVLYNVCPNCGGGFEKRPIRPRDRRRSPQPAAYIHPVDPEKQIVLRMRLEHIAPENR